MREDEKAYFNQKMAKNLSIPLLPQSIEDEIKAEEIEFKKDKTKGIKKQHKVMT